MDLLNNLNWGEVRISKKIMLLLPYVSLPKIIEETGNVIKFKPKLRMDTYLSRGRNYFSFRILGFGLFYLKGN